MSTSVSSSLRSKRSSLFKEHEDDDYPTFSLVAETISQYAHKNEVGNKMNFCQIALAEFRNMFETDDMFKKVKGKTGMNIQCLDVY